MVIPSLSLISISNMVPDLWEVLSTDCKGFDQKFGTEKTLFPDFDQCLGKADNPKMAWLYQISAFWNLESIEDSSVTVYESFRKSKKCVSVCGGRDNFFSLPPKVRLEDEIELCYWYPYFFKKNIWQMFRGKS